jgi:hypothetical protein
MSGAGEVDERGVRFDSPLYPHTIDCVMRAMDPYDPKPWCNCGGNEVLDG